MMESEASSQHPWLRAPFSFVPLVEEGRDRLMFSTGSRLVFRLDVTWGLLQEHSKACLPLDKPMSSFKCFAVPRSPSMEQHAKHGSDRQRSRRSPRSQCLRQARRWLWSIEALWKGCCCRLYSEKEHGTAIPPSPVACLRHPSTGSHGRYSSGSTAFILAWQ